MNWKDGIGYEDRAIQNDSKSSRIRVVALSLFICAEAPENAKIRTEI